MDDLATESACRTPEEGDTLEHALTSIVPELRAFRRRSELAASPLWREHASEIGRITRALRFGTPEPAPPPVPWGAAPRFLRVVAWNIERGKQVAGQAAFLRDHPVLAAADVLLVNEVDVGMARSDDLDVARELARALGFYHVFGCSYLCLDRGNVRDAAAGRENRLGLAGNAIFSRFPIVRAENVSVEITKDKFASSERRLGHKKALWAEIAAPTGRLAVASVHLDSSASPAQRAAQLRDLLGKLAERGVADRCVVGGDFNTTTYDLASTPRLAANILAKLVRGGFPHAIHHYVHPHELYEKAVFDVLDAAGFDWRTFNDLGVGTSRYEVGTFDSESKVRDYLPDVFVRVLAWRLRPWNGVAPLQIDWLAGRGLRPLERGEIDDLGRASISPASFPRPRHDGTLLSDHDPIAVDVDLDTPPTGFIRKT